jgi:hypothetical protein
MAEWSTANILIELLISFIGSIPALLFALWVDKRRMPKLEITASEEANSDNTYTLPNLHAGERWKFFRVTVKNKPFTRIFSWIPRQTAENCRGKIEFSKIGTEELPPSMLRRLPFSMLGRWISSPELSYLSKSSAILKILQPDPVTIPINEKGEILDVITKCENDKEAYGWNNEAYFNNWRTPHYKLEGGKYAVKISIATQNGVTFAENFELTVSDKIEDTFLKNVER